MANVNRVFLLGRLTRDAETRTFASGGKVANLGFAVTGERKKNPQTGQWEDTPCFVDLKAFNRETGRKTADLLGDLKKGTPLFIEGHLVLETWEDKNGGGRRSKHVVVVDDFQYLAPKGDTGSQRPAAPAPEPEEDQGGAGGEIPF